MNSVDETQGRVICVVYTYMDILQTKKTFLSLSEALDKESMDAKRMNWLKFHDQKTGGIMGLFPLIRGMPVRLTAHINRELALYKTSKCKVHGWKLSVNEAHTSLCPPVNIPLSPLVEIARCS